MTSDAGAGARRGSLALAVPGPGSWRLQEVQFPRPMTAFVAQPMMNGFRRGMAEGTARFGLLLDGFEPAVVRGFFYYQPIPRQAPPRWVLSLVTRIHPRLRRRIALSRRAFEQKLWREDLDRWDDDLKPAAIRAHRALQEVDPASLTAIELAGHLHACRDHYERMVYQHHRFTATCALPVGDYLASAVAWTSKSTGELLQLLSGSSPISLGVAAADLAELGRAVRVDPGAAASLGSGRPASAVLGELRDDPGPTGRAMRAYLDVVGHRSVGYDVCEATALELPDLLLRNVRVAVETVDRVRQPDPAAAERLARIRDAVPADHRAELDDLLTEARHVNRLRDERGIYSDMWAAGLARRGLLEAGRRLVDGGRLAAAELAVDATCEEVERLLSGDGGPSGEELTDRAAWRRTHTVADAPPWLGRRPRPLPPPEWLPEDARRAARAVTFFMAGLLEDAATGPAARTVSGVPASPGVYEGTARRALGQADLGRIQRGDVLVTQSTSPSFNVVLPLLGAVVTDRGGQLCHAAIVAREYGIPCVVGTREATRVIEDGARVRVDGDRGVVELLGAPGAAEDRG